MFFAPDIRKGTNFAVSPQKRENHINVIFLLCVSYFLCSLIAQIKQEQPAAHACHAQQTVVAQNCRSSEYNLQEALKFQDSHKAK